MMARMIAKEQYLLRGATSTPVAEFADAVLRDLAPRLLAQDPRPLRVTLTTRPPPRASVFPFRRSPLALISLWGGGPAGELAGLLGEYGQRVEGYRVQESEPVRLERGWPDGQPTPGEGLLTLLRRRPGLDDATFIRRWHGGHTPLTLEVHPVWAYVRNVVQQASVPGSPPLDGIVEEHFRRPGDLHNPLRFFGGPLWMIPNMIRVWLDIRRWLDTSDLQTYLVTEVQLRS
jgi:hypothetical protein